MELARSILASLSPQKTRRWWYPAEPVNLVRGTAISGLAELLLFGCLEFQQFSKHFLANANHFSRGNLGTQLVAVFVVVIAEFFYPLSLLFILLFIEGLIRLIAALIVHEALPSLPVALLVRLWLRRNRAHQALPTR